MTFLSIFWDHDGSILTIGSFSLKFYSFMWLISFIVGYIIMKKIYKREGQPNERMESLFLYGVLSIMIGARLGHVIFYDWAYYQDHLLEIFLPIKTDPFRLTGFRGLASHGAALGAIIGMTLYRRKFPDLKLSWILDRLVIPSALGAVFVRIGNFMNSEIIGKYTGTDYGIVFARLGETLPRHPAQLYEAMGYVLVFTILYLVYYKTNKGQKPWFLFGLFFVLLMGVRFVVEFFKEAQVDNRAEWALNTGQWLSIPFVIIGLYLMFRKTSKTA